MRRIIVRLVLSIAIASLLIYWLASQGFHIVPGLGSIRSIATTWVILAYAALFSLFNMLRAWRWELLLRPFTQVRRGPMMETAFVGFLAIQMMPLRTGEVVRPYLLDRYAGISKSALFGTIAIERVLDGLVVSLFLTVALLTVPLGRSPYVLGLRVVPLAAFVAALVLLFAFHKAPERVGALLGRVIGVFSKRLADFTVGVVERFHGGLAALPDKRAFWGFVVVTALYWGINAVAFQVLAVGCGLDLSFAGACAGMGVLAVGILLPAGPGYFGNFQISVLVALEMYLGSAAHGEPAAVFIFLLYVLQTGLTVLFGGIASIPMLHRPVVRRTSMPAPPGGG
jgi:glycosyltransferase 2 family protein